MIFGHELTPHDLQAARAALQDLGGQASVDALLIHVGEPDEYMPFLVAALLEPVVEGGRPFAIPAARLDEDGDRLWVRLDLATAANLAEGAELLRRRGLEAMARARRLEAAASPTLGGAVVVMPRVDPPPPPSADLPVSHEKPLFRKVP